MAEGEISVGGALSFAWSILSQHWRAIWGVLALNALSWTVLVAGVFAIRPELVAAGLAAILITNYPLSGAVFRLAIGPQSGDNPDLSLGALGIQWRAMELRIFLADLLALIFRLIIAMLLMVAAMAVFFGVYSAEHGGPPPDIKTQADLIKALGPQGDKIYAGVQLVLWLLSMYLNVRLFVAASASGLGGRVAVLSTWRMTRGSFFPILGSYLLVQVPVLITSVVTTAALVGQIGHLSAAQVLSYSVLSGVMAGAASAPLTAGLQAYFYKMLGPLPPKPPKPADGPGT